LNAPSSTPLARPALVAADFPRLQSPLSVVTMGYIAMSSVDRGNTRSKVRTRAGEKAERGGAVFAARCQRRPPSILLTSHLLTPT
jgi:hypothetical protein